MCDLYSRKFADTAGASVVARAIARLNLQGVGRAQWYAFFGSFLGWVFDGFDFSILTFILIDIEHSLGVGAALAGALGSITLVFRLIGGVGAGTAADRFGRKNPLAFSILWFAIFSLLSAFSTNYAFLFGCRALFGIGMGGVWAAGMPLALEHWPQKLRGVVSGLLQGGFYWGYVLAAIVFALIHPLLRSEPALAWRVFFLLGALPALLALFIFKRVNESPVWLARQGHLQQMHRKEELSLAKIFRRGLIGTTLHTSLLMSIFMFSYYSITFWYPTFLRRSALSPLQYVIALNIGGICGAALWGRTSDSGLGRRGAVALATVVGLFAIPLFIETGDRHLLLLGAVLMGASGTGIWGMVPSYLTERFPSAARAVGPSFAYHFGAAAGSLTPTVIGLLQDRGVRLPNAMAVCIAISSLLIVTIIWLGPETRGRAFSTTE
jgi:SHS family lactate transporter-like MFS transporter